MGHRARCLCTAFFRASGQSQDCAAPRSKMPSHASVKANRSSNGANGPLYGRCFGSHLWQVNEAAGPPSEVAEIVQLRTLSRWQTRAAKNKRWPRSACFLHLAKARPFGLRRVTSGKAKKPLVVPPLSSRHMTGLGRGRLWCWVGSYGMPQSCFLAFLTIRSRSALCLQSVAVENTRCRPNSFVPAGPKASRFCRDQSAQKCTVLAVAWSSFRKELSFRLQEVQR